jgi:hypothetical protein
VGKTQAEINLEKVGDPIVAGPAKSEEGISKTRN